MYAEIGIVGAGPAGLFLAQLLAAQGRSVVLWETRPEITRKVCGDYICPPGVDFLRKHGLTSIVEKARPVQNIRIVTPSMNTLDYNMPKDHCGIALSRKDFDQSLLDKARELGAHIHMACKVSQLHIIPKEKCYQVQTTQGKWTVSLVIGADGRQSKVAALRGLKSSRSNERVAVRGFVPRLNQSVDDFGIAMHLFSDATYIGINHLDTYASSITLVLLRSALRNFQSPQIALKTYAQRSSILQNSYDLSHLSTVDTVYPIFNKVHRVSDQRLALVGDAAGFVDPVTGEGNYMALLTAKLLANSLGQVKDLSNEVAMNQALSTYRKDHQAHVKKKLNLNTWLQRLIHQPWGIELVCQHLNAKPRRIDAFGAMITNLQPPSKMLWRCIL